MILKNIMKMRRELKDRRKTLLSILSDKKINIKNSLEIGVAAGDFSELIINRLNPKTHYMVDPWIDESTGMNSQWFSKGNDPEESYNFVVNRFKDLSVKIIRLKSDDFFKKNKIKFDMIYVDGDHHSDAVFRDLENSYLFLNVGGILAGDDLNWISKTTKKEEIKIAVQKFENKYNVKFNIVKGDNNGLNQFYLIKK